MNVRNEVYLWMAGSRRPSSVVIEAIDAIDAIEATHLSILSTA